LTAVEKEYENKEIQLKQEQVKTRLETLQLLDANHQKSLQNVKERQIREEQEMKAQHEQERAQLQTMSKGKHQEQKHNT